jgi:YihY family inner membrane protein
VGLIARAAWKGVGEFYSSEGLTHAASIAFYALLSIFPFFLLLFSVIGGLTEDPAARDSVVSFVFRYFPRQFDFVSGQIDSFRTDRVGIGVGGGLALAYASLGVFNAMSSAVNHAWGVEKKRSFIRHRLFSFLMMVAAGAMFVLAIGIVAAVRVVEARWFSSLQVKGAGSTACRASAPTGPRWACWSCVWRSSTASPNVKVTWPRSGPAQF